MNHAAKDLEIHGVYVRIASESFLAASTGQELPSRLLLCSGHPRALMLGYAGQTQSNCNLMCPNERTTLRAKPTSFKSLLTK